MSKVIALDWGGKRIGWAVSDPTCTIVSDKGVYERVGEVEDTSFIKSMIAELEPSELVIGLPRNMDGTLGVQAQKVIDFKNKLAEEIDIPIKLFDERLTTKEAERILIQADMTRRNRKKVIDGISASIILQAFLDQREEQD